MYVKSSGLWKLRLTNLLAIDLKTLNRILKEDEGFSRNLKAADAEFCGNIIARARPEFILKTKYRDEFPDVTKIETGQGTDKRLEEFLDRAAYMTNARRRELDGQPPQG